MSYADAELFMVDDSTFLTDITQCGYCLKVHSIIVDLMMGEDALFTVAYWQCVQDPWAHFELSLYVHYGELGGGAYHVGLCILYWMTQQEFLYYLSEHKFGQDLPLPDFAGLLCHVHTKTLDGFLSCLPASWLKKVHPDTQIQTNQGAPAPSSPDPHPTHNCGSPELVTNTNYVNSMKKHWLASGLSNLQAMLQAHSGDGALPVPKMGDQEVCLS